ncbi:MAG: AIR synthase-related protein [Bacteroidota bacterium]
MGIQTIYVRRTDDPEAASLLARLRHQGYTRLTDLIIERVYRLEGDCDAAALRPLFVNPVFEADAPVSGLDPAHGPVIEIGYRRAVTDPETPSILSGAWALGQTGLSWARLALRYQLQGVTTREAEEIAALCLYNPVVQEIIPPGHVFSSLRPTGAPDPVRRVSLLGLDDEELARASRENSWYAPLSQMRALKRYEEDLGRPLTDAEIEICVQSWSDHCYHTTWKSLGLLKKLMAATATINHPDVVSVFRDNAGGLALTADWVVTIKGETHNFPSAIATFGGVATKHGGVIRDSIGFGRGGYPIGGSTIMGTMDPRLPAHEVPAGALPPGHIVRESIRATAYYCNPMGIPMMYSLYRAHPGYPKCLALGHSLGLIPRRYAAKESPQPGDAVLLIGGRTGRDGLHGATASSAEMETETRAKESAAVQIGHPITERKFMEAIPVLRDAGIIRSITDLGAGGLSCAAGEMGEATGIRLELDAVPLKDASLTAWEILLSESQERMLIAVPPDKLDEALAILDRYDVLAAKVGVFTATHRYQAMWRHEMVVDLGMEFLWGACPIDRAETRTPGPKHAPVPPPPAFTDLPECARRVLAHYHCCDQSAAGLQFDSTVQGRTIIGPYGGRTGRMPTNAFVSMPLRGENVGVVSTVAYNPFYGELDAAGYARLAMVEAISRAIAVGGDPKCLALCDNFYTPRSTPAVNGSLVRMVETIADLSVAYGMPFISGKDSSSGTMQCQDGRTIEVPLTLVVATLGRVPDVHRCVNKPLRQAGDLLVLAGDLWPDRLGGSVYLDTFGTRGDRLHDGGEAWAAGLLPLWRRLFALYGSAANPVRAAAAIGEGGLFAKVFEMAYGGGLGAEIDLDAFPGARWDGVLFAEAVGAFVLEVPAGTDLEDLFPGLPCRVIGRVTEAQDLIVRRGDLSVVLPLADLVSAWEGTFREVVF